MVERRSRARMIEETRAKLISAARKAFAERGYAAVSMDDLCADAGLTRGALYHHFGGKEGLLEAVVVEIDREVFARLDTPDADGADPWQTFRSQWIGYLDLAIEPEIQRICLRDAPAVLGQRLRDLDTESSLGALMRSLALLMEEGAIRVTSVEALARIINGATMEAAIWVAASEDPAERLAQAKAALETILDGIRLPPGR